jgi:hypothetical protein
MEKKILHVSNIILINFFELLLFTDARLDTQVVDPNYNLFLFQMHLFRSTVIEIPLPCDT